jgi:hypothetical protein
MNDDYHKRLIAIAKIVGEKGAALAIDVSDKDLIPVLSFISEVNHLLGYIMALEELQKK